MAPNSLDTKIRAVVVELIDSAPIPRPLPELDQPSPSRSGHVAPKVRFGLDRVRGRGVLLPAASLIILGIVGLVADSWSSSNRAIPKTSSSKFVTEATLGFKMTSYMSPPPPVPKGSQWPAVFTYVGSGTFFGVPWSVYGAAPPTQQICMGFVFAKTSASWSCLGPRKSNPLPQTEAGVNTGDVTAPNGQRFLLVVTNGAITELRVRAPDGETVSAYPLPQRLGNTSYFMVSLGRVGGVCSNLCRGPVSVTFLTSAGPVDVGAGQSSITQTTGGGFGGPLDTPVAK
jgi:hypothetical protein